MNTIYRHLISVQAGKIAVEYTAITVLITAFCVGAVKYGVVQALFAVLCVSVVTEISARLNAKPNPVSNTIA
jgi:Flp pilus assembly pilin Flp